MDIENRWTWIYFQTNRLKTRKLLARLKENLNLHLITGQQLQGLLIRPKTEIEGIRMFSTEDIIAMKVQAILGRGKKKDFWDIAELLNHFPIADFVQFHKEKYATQNLVITVPQAITYFADAEESEDPISLKTQTWKSVQEIINGKVREYLA
jgi:predicted nucleotidyltransferase component of viral defense system